MQKPLTKFFKLSSPDSAARYAEWSEEMDLESIYCPINPDHRRGSKRIGDLRITLPDLPVQDFVWTGPRELLIQNKVLDLFKSEEITGFRVAPVQARFKKSSAQPPQLWELTVTGWGGLAPSETGIERVEYCDACGYAEYSPLRSPSALNAPQWDGSDFFIIWPMPRFVFITERLASVIRNHKLKGAVITDIETMKNDGLGFGPGRLNRWMPDTRARQVGEPLGIYWSPRRSN